MIPGNQISNYQIPIPPKEYILNQIDLCIKNNESDELWSWFHLYMEYYMEPFPDVISM